MPEKTVLRLDQSVTSKVSGVFLFSPKAIDQMDFNEDLYSSNLDILGPPPVRCIFHATGTAPLDLRQPGKGRPIAYWMLWATVVIRIRTNDRASCAVLST